MYKPISFISRPELLQVHFLLGPLCLWKYQQSFVLTIVEESGFGWKNLARETLSSL